MPFPLIPLHTPPFPSSSNFQVTKNLFAGDSTGMDLYVESGSIFMSMTPKVKVSKKMAAAAAAATAAAAVPEGQC